MVIPAVLIEMLQEPSSTGAVQLSVPLLTVTVPVGVPAPGATGLTLYLKVTLCPTTDGSGSSSVIVVVVLASPADVYQNYVVRSKQGDAFSDHLNKNGVEVLVQFRKPYYRHEALRLNPNHPGALHVMGVWNAEVMRRTRSGSCWMVASFVIRPFEASCM